MSSVNRERALETKLNLIEKRLVLVERFVEMRFCESFREFSIRNGNSFSISTTSNDHDEEGGGNVNGRNKKSINTGMSKSKTELQQAQKVENAAVTKPVTVVPDSEDNEDKESYVQTRTTRSGRSTRLPARLSSPATSPALSSSPRPKKKKTADGDQTSKPTSTTLTTSGSQPFEPIIKTAPLSDDDEASTQRNEDNDYFSFSFEDDTSQAKETTDENINMESDNDFEPTAENDESDFETETSETLKKKKSSSKRKDLTPRKKPSTPSTSSPSSSTLILQNSSREQCSVCHKYIKKELLPSHMAFHTKERHLKCAFCDKMFFNKSMVIKHQKLHNPEKYSRKCRLCDKRTIESGKMLAHERSCIRRALEQGKHVDPEFMRDIRSRSLGVDLKWPDDLTAKKNMKKCSYCSQYFHGSVYLKHVKTHATWQCTMCDNSYINKEGLVKHMRNVHGAGSSGDNDRNNSNDDGVHVKGEQTTDELQDENGSEAEVSSNDKTTEKRE